MVFELGKFFTLFGIILWIRNIPFQFSEVSLTWRHGIPQKIGFTFFSLNGMILSVLCKSFWIFSCFFSFSFSLNVYAFRTDRVPVHKYTINMTSINKTVVFLINKYSNDVTNSHTEKGHAKQKQKKSRRKRYKIAIHKTAEAKQMATFYHTTINHKFKIRKNDVLYS